MTDAESFDGPPEPVVNEDGDVEVLVPTGEPLTTGTPYQTVELGIFRCTRCDTLTPGAVSDGQLVEPAECDGCERSGPFNHAGGIDGQTALRAPRMWHPPAGVNDEGYGDLWDDVLEYLRDHWDAGDGDEAEAVYAGLTAFALSTWLREELTFVPHLMLMGQTTGGKTRLLNTLARVCFRAHVTASATPASMFRLIDSYDVTYFVSEYHGLPYETQRQLDAVLRAGQKRGEYVDRAEQTATGQYEPDTFDPFAHVAVATQYTPDDDIVNRCIQVRSSPADRDMPAVLDEDRARDLRDRLLYARFRLLESDEWAESEAAAYDYLATRDITGRTREKLLSLLGVALCWGRTDAFGRFVDEVVRQDREAAHDSEDARIVEAIRDEYLDRADDPLLGDAVPIPYDAVVERFEENTGMEKSNSWLGHARKRLGLESERISGVTHINDPDLPEKLAELCDDHHLDWSGPEPESGEEAADRVLGVIRANTGGPQPTALDESQVVAHATRAGLTPEQVDRALDKLRQRGDVVEMNEGEYEPAE